MLVCQTLKNLVVLTISYVTINLKAERGCPTFKTLDSNHYMSLSCVCFS
jgi:hypothetical protein